MNLKSENLGHRHRRALDQGPAARPGIFEERPDVIYAVYFSFILANVLLVFFGHLSCPVVALLGILTIATWLLPLYPRLFRKLPTRPPRP